ncbi:MAG TPA: glycosyltransferase family 4 protein [Nitrospirota bacterium]
MARLSVLHTESSMNLGGQELRILGEMEGLIARGHSQVLAARPGSRIADEARARGLKVYEVRMRGSFDPLAVVRMAFIILNERINIVNAHGSKDGWSAGLAARLLLRKVVRSRHIANPVRAHFFGRLVYGPLCDMVMTTSESIRQGMADRGVRPDKIISIPTGIDIEKFNLGMPTGGFRAEMGAEGKKLVGMVAVMRGDKGPDIFVRAAEEVLKVRQDAVFVLVGDGWMRGKLEEMAASSPYSGSIRLTGHRNDIPRVYADLDLFVLPARAPEGVPQAVLQAHAMKVPVVASALGGITEVAIPGITALCVKPDDYNALAAAIISMLDHPDNAKSLSEAGHRLVLDKYSFKGMLDQMERLYSSVSGCKPPHSFFGV